MKASYTELRICYNAIFSLSLFLYFLDLRWHSICDKIGDDCYASTTLVQACDQQLTFIRTLSSDSWIYALSLSTKLVYLEICLCWVGGLKCINSATVG
jgi:hypothetical protein